MSADARFRRTTVFVLAIMTAGGAIGAGLYALDADDHPLTHESGADLDGQVGVDVDVDGPDLPDVDVHVDDPTGGTVGHAEFTFDLPLRTLGGREHFRFRDSADQPRGDVVIHATWNDELGRPQSYADGPHEAARLIMRSDDGTQHTMSPDRYDHGGTTAVFKVAAGELATGRVHTDWWIIVEAPNQAASIGGASVGGSSVYHRDHGTSAAIADAASLLGLGTAVRVVDSDNDRVPDGLDNCPHDRNSDQANLDQDLEGDACDDDIDSDGASNAEETRAGSDPYDPESTPDDPDADGWTNAEEDAARSDPHNPDSTPHDQDADGWPTDVEDDEGSDPHDASSTPVDRDGDGDTNEHDNCPDAANSDQADGDADGIGDACDMDPDDGPNGDQDGDGVVNQHDLCPSHYDTIQSDADDDGTGDGCDSDRDGDGVTNRVDDFPDDPSEWTDTDGDGTGDNADPDDDGDGLSDDVEAGFGSDPKMADSDRDQLDDPTEMTMGTDPNDPYDPDYAPYDLSVTPRADGSIEVSWSGKADTRIDRYLIWMRSAPVLVGTVAADGTSYTFIHDDHPGGDHMYSVQARFADHPDVFRIGDSTHAPLFEARILAVTAPGSPGSGEGPFEVIEDGPDADPNQAADHGAADSEDSPVPVGVAVFAIGLAVWLRRRQA